MDDNTQKLLTFVVCFSIATKTYKDIITLWTGVPQLLTILTTPITVPILIYLSKMMLFLMTLISAFIVPIHLLKYFAKKGRITLAKDFTYFMFKPQLYCAIIGIVQWLLSILFSVVFSWIY